MTTQESVDLLLDKVRDLLIQDQKDKGIRTTGQSAEEIKKTVNGDRGGELTGPHYFRQQKDGRKPGKFAPPQAILQWIKDKGITPRDPKTSLESLAFLFNRKLAREGSDIYLGRRPALNINEKLKELLKEFRDNTRKGMKGKITESIKRAVAAE